VVTISLLLVIRIPGARSLKDRRAVVRSLVERLRSRLGVATAEVGGQQRLRYAEIGVAIVSGDLATARARAEDVRRFAGRELLGRAEVVRTLVEETHLTAETGLTADDGGRDQLDEWLDEAEA